MCMIITKTTTTTTTTQITTTWQEHDYPPLMPLAVVGLCWYSCWLSSLLLVVGAGPSKPSSRTYNKVINLFPVALLSCMLQPCGSMLSPACLYEPCGSPLLHVPRWWAWTLIKGLSPELVLQVRAKVASLEALKGQRTDLGLQRTWEGNYLVSRGLPGDSCHPRARW